MKEKRRGQGARLPSDRAGDCATRSFSSFFPRVPRVPLSTARALSVKSARCRLTLVIRLLSDRLLNVNAPIQVSPERVISGYACKWYASFASTQPGPFNATLNSRRAHLEPAAAKCAVISTDIRRVTNGRIHPVDGVHVASLGKIVRLSLISIPNLAGSDPGWWALFRELVGALCEPLGEVRGGGAGWQKRVRTLYTKGLSVLTCRYKVCLVSFSVSVTDC